VGGGEKVPFFVSIAGGEEKGTGFERQRSTLPGQGKERKKGKYPANYVNGPGGKGKE